ncbi:MAG: type VI secretion system accessory protein TagJ [Fimbriiglobus sp.]
MTPTEALAAGRLRRAIELQRETLLSNPTTKHRLFLAELLAVAGKFRSARELLDGIEDPSTEWAESLAEFVDLLRADHRRCFHTPRPHPLDENVSDYHLARLKVAKSIRNDDEHLSNLALQHADSLAPEMNGYIDGREFETGLRDVDDRYGATLEFFDTGRAYTIAWTAVRSLKFLPVRGMLDSVHRPATLELRQGLVLDVRVPLTYQASVMGKDTYRLGLDSIFGTRDHVTLGIGARMYLVDGDELTLRECHHIEITHVPEY